MLAKWTVLCDADELASNAHGIEYDEEGVSKVCEDERRHVELVEGIIAENVRT